MKRVLLYLNIISYNNYLAAELSIICMACVHCILVRVVGNPVKGPCNCLPIKAGGAKISLVRPAYSYNIVLIVIIVFVLKALINLYARSEY